MISFLPVFVSSHLIPLSNRISSPFCIFKPKDCDPKPCDNKPKDCDPKPPACDTKSKDCDPKPPACDTKPKDCDPKPSCDKPKECEPRCQPQHEPKANDDCAVLKVNKNICGDCKETSVSTKLCGDLNAVKTKAAIMMIKETGAKTKRTNVVIMMTKVIAAKKKKISAIMTNPAAMTNLMMVMMRNPFAAQYLTKITAMDVKLSHLVAKINATNG